MLASGYNLKTTASLPVTESGAEATKFFLDLWKRKAAGRFAPSREEIDWLEMPMDVVPRIMIVDVLGPPLDFQYRYFGTWHVECHGRDLTGTRVSEYVDPDYRKFVLADYAEVVAARRPTLSTVSMILKDLPYTCEILRLPLSSDAAAVDKIMVVESQTG